MSTYRVYARDVNYRRLGEIDDYGELSAVIRFNDFGTWHLTASASSSAARLLDETGGIIITRDNGDGPRVVFSGPVTDLNLDDEQIEVAGYSDELLLQESRAFPDPAGPPYAYEQDLREGIASTVMLAYIENNIGSLATAVNRVSALAVGTDLGLGSYVYGRARFPTLLFLMQELALGGGGLRFQVLQSDVTAGQIVFSVSEPANRSSIIVSRERGTLGTWKRSVVRPAATHVIVLGLGQGINRSVRESSDTAGTTKYGRRIVAVVDRRDTSDSAELEQALAVALAESGEQQSVTFTPIDTRETAWGIDYDLGDLVTVRVNGVDVPEIVREVELTLSADGAVEVQPIVSTPGDSADDPSTRQIRAVDRRVSNLERNTDALVAAVSVQWNIGNIRMTATGAAAPGWILCDGSAVSRSIYSDLFTIIGTTYGAGNGSTTFNVPDFRDRGPVGKSGTKTLGSTGGATTIDISHAHTGAPHTHSHSHTGAGHTHDHAHNGAPHTHSHTHTGPSHQHTGAAHTHSHTHTGPSHTHTGAAHTHPGSHSHGGTTDGPSALNGLGNGGGTSVPSTTHTHTFTTATDSNVFAASFSSQTGAAGTGATGSDASAASFSGDTGAAGTGATGSDASAASFSNTTGTTSTGATFSTPTGTDASAAAFSGNTGTGGSSSLSVQNPYIAVSFEIYAGV